MRKTIFFSGLLILFCLMFSCNKDTPTTPSTPTTTPTITVTNVTVTSPNTTIPVGATEQMTATVTLSNGTTRAGNGTWGGDAPLVATVTQTGLVTALSPGDVTIFFDEAGTVTSSGGVTMYLGGHSETAISSGGATINIDGHPRTAIPSGEATGNSIARPAMRGTKRLTVRALWSKNGQGANVFDMPTYVKRVRITGTYNGHGENFVVWIGNDLVVNEILGTSWGSTTYAGTFLTNGGVVQVKYSNGLSWTFNEVLPSATQMAYPNIFSDPPAPHSFGYPAVLPDNPLIRIRESEASMGRQKIK